MGIICVVAPQIRTNPDPGTARQNIGWKTVQYAYCLLDLAAEDVKNPTKVFQQYEGYISEEISKEVRWQLPCRTKGNGCLVVIDEKKNPNYVRAFYGNDEGSKRMIDRLPTLTFNCGVKLNLYWTYNYEKFKAARNNKTSPYKKENQLHLCSTKFALEDAEYILSAFNLKLNFRQLVAKNPTAFAAYIKKRLFLDQKSYTRIPIHVEPTLVSLSPKKWIIKNPHLPLVDYDLEHALKISDLIIEAESYPERQDLSNNLARLEQVLMILEQHDKEKKEAKKKGKAFFQWNDILPLAYAERGRYEQAKRNIEMMFPHIVDYIQDCGKILEQIYPNAIEQLKDHYDEEVVGEYFLKLQEAANIYAYPKFWKMISSTDEEYNRRLEKVIDGKEPEDFLDKLLRSYRTIGWGGGGKRWVDIVNKSTQWVERFLPKIIEQKPDKVVSILNRINNLLYTMEQIKLDVKSPYVEQVFTLSKEGIMVKTTDFAGKEVNINISGKIVTLASKVSKIASRMVAYCNVVNLLLAYKDVSEDVSFQNCVKTFKASADVAKSFQSISSQLENHYGTAKGITKTHLARAAGGALIFLCFMDANKELKRGNNLAVLGNMVMALGGTMQVLSKAGTIGWVAAAGILAGTIIIYYSLSDNEKYILYFEDRGYIVQAEKIPRFLRNDIALREHEEYVKTRYGSV